MRLLLVAAAFRATSAPAFFPWGNHPALYGQVGTRPPDDRIFDYLEQTRGPTGAVVSSWAELPEVSPTEDRHPAALMGRDGFLAHRSDFQSDAALRTFLGLDSEHHDGQAVRTTTLSQLDQTALARMKLPAFGYSEWAAERQSRSPPVEASTREFMRYVMRTHLEYATDTDANSRVGQLELKWSNFVASCNSVFGGKAGWINEGTAHADIRQELMTTAVGMMDNSPREKRMFGTPVGTTGTPCCVRETLGWTAAGAGAKGAAKAYAQFFNTYCIDKALAGATDASTIAQCYYTLQDGSTRLKIMTVMDDTVGGIMGSLYAAATSTALPTCVADACNGGNAPGTAIAFDKQPTNQLGDRIDPTINMIMVFAGTWAEFIENRMHGTTFRYDALNDNAVWGPTYNPSETNALDKWTGPANPQEWYVWNPLSQQCFASQGWNLCALSATKESKCFFKMIFSQYDSRGIQSEICDTRCTSERTCGYAQIQAGPILRACVTGESGDSGTYTATPIQRRMLPYNLAKKISFQDEFYSLLIKRQSMQQSLGVDVAAEVWLHDVGYGHWPLNQPGRATPEDRLVEGVAPSVNGPSSMFTDLIDFGNQVLDEAVRKSNYRTQFEYTESSASEVAFRQSLSVKAYVASWVPPSPPAVQACRSLAGSRRELEQEQQAEIEHEVRIMQERKAARRRRLGLRNSTGASGTAEAREHGTKNATNPPPDATAQQQLAKLEAAGRRLDHEGDEDAPTPAERCCNDPCEVSNDCYDPSPLIAGEETPTSGLWCCRHTHVCMDRSTASVTGPKCDECLGATGRMQAVRTAFEMPGEIGDFLSQQDSMMAQFASLLGVASSQIVLSATAGSVLVVLTVMTNSGSELVSVQASLEAAFADAAAASAFLGVTVSSVSAISLVTVPATSADTAACGGGTCACGVFRNGLTSDDDGSDACFAIEPRGNFGNRAVCQPLEPAPFEADAPCGCPAGMQRCTVAWLAPIFPACECEEYALGAEPGASQLCQQKPHPALDEYICHKMRDSHDIHWGDDFGNYGCPDDWTPCADIGRVHLAPGYAADLLEDAPAGGALANGGYNPGF